MIDRTTTTIAAILLLTAGTLAQDVTVERTGRFNFDVTAAAEKTSASTLLSAIARKTGFELRVPNSATTDQLTATSIEIDVQAMSLDRIIALVAGAADLHADIDFENETIRLRGLPEPSDEEAAEFYRLQALRELLRAFGGAEDPDREVELLWSSAELQIAGKQYRTALDTLSKLVNGHGGHPRAPEACLLAGRCALKAKDADSALGMADKYLNEYFREPGLVKARIIAVQASLLGNNVADAQALLRGIIRDGRGPNVDERDVLISEYLLAELYRKTNELDAALQVLEQVRWRHDSTLNKDLLGQVPLFIGLLHIDQGKLERAVHDLRLAAYTCATAELRGRVLRAQARTFLRLDSPFESLSAIRVALRLDPQGADLIATRRLEARAYRAMFLDVNAIDVLVGLLEKIPTIIPEEMDRDLTAATILEELGAILFEAEDWARARDVFARIRDVDGMGPRAVLMIARAELQSGDPKRALDVLDGMPHGATPAALKDATALRGDCYVALKLYERAINVWKGDG